MGRAELAQNMRIPKSSEVARAESKGNLFSGGLLRGKSMA